MYSVRHCRRARDCAENPLVFTSLGFLDTSPHEREPFVEAKLFPHLKPFFSSQSSAFDEAMKATVIETVLVTFVVKSRENLDIRLEK